MDQLPIFLNLKGHKIVLLGTGDAADAKRRLIERAGGICVGVDDTEARLAFVALDGEAAMEAASELKARGLLVNVVDRPELCDFTTPAIVDRSPVLVAVGTGGASAGLAKAIRQRIERVLPQSLGSLALSISTARDAIRARWPDAADRRRALDAAFAEGGALDPMRDHACVESWLEAATAPARDMLIEINLVSADPDDLSLRHARLLGEADHVFHDDSLPVSILERARADAVRHVGAPPASLPSGLVLYLRLP